MNNLGTKSRRLDILGVELEWKLRAAETLDQYCILAALVPPGVGIPPHRHPDQEAFLVLDGEPEFAVSTGAALEWRTARPGDMVNIPPHALHGFRNASNRAVKLLIACAPGLGRFFEEAGMPLADNESACPNPAPEDVRRVLSIAEKHGQRFAPPV